ncbi:MAG: hypothetical protein CMF38_07915 [Legionellaceae bacterium]|nr:hypothetical protein [Legionellaceae bacterium]|tara:strand:+ start:696 stop:1232 length:537 start_codon:yes stop_codon:yes gene_type:complete
MQIKKSIIIISILIFLINSSIAAPLFQILQTCINNKPYNDMVTITKLPNEGAADQRLDGCEEQYEFIFNAHTYGTVICNNKFYLIVYDTKIDPKLANNRSINPEIKPGVEFTPRAIWYKIDYKHKAYLCILAPLTEQGIGSSYNQYYVIENAFDASSTPKLYFYFLDKNIAPITSKTL